MKYNILGIMLITISMPLAAASFNCHKASTDVEHSICDDSALNQADSKMAKAYSHLRKTLPRSERRILKKDQHKWLKKRNSEFADCGEGAEGEWTDVPMCRLSIYKKRIQQLSPIAQASFNCKKASTKAEKKICSSRLLRHADGIIAKYYKPIREEFREDQRNWIKVRDAELSSSSCNVECAWELFKDRINTLSNYSF
jgi:uncharacterized protein